MACASREERGHLAPAGGVELARAAGAGYQALSSMTTMSRASGCARSAAISRRVAVRAGAADGIAEGVDVGGAEEREAAGGERVGEGRGVGGQEAEGTELGAAVAGGGELVEVGLGA